MPTATTLLKERESLLKRLDELNKAIAQLQHQCTHPKLEHVLYDGHYEYYSCPDCGLLSII